MSEPVGVMAPHEIPSVKMDRCIAQVRGRQSGPLLVCVAGLHGNEPSGVHAAQTVRRRLNQPGGEFRGEWIALAGNLPAIEAGRRFFQRDLNRIWQPERVEWLRKCFPEALEAEDRQQCELLHLVEKIFAQARGPVFVMDLHSTSADGMPFAVIEDTLRNRRFASYLPIPGILGFEEEIGGTFSEFVTALGHFCISIEGGQHTLPSAVDNHESIIWLAMEGAGLISAEDWPEVDKARSRLSNLCRHESSSFEVCYRHAIEPRDHFRMEPGFQNFVRIREGEVVAHDCLGEIHAPMSGRLIMPLYQKLGEDGFFLAREFNPFWLHLSAWMRSLNLDRVVHWLPGVHRHPEMKGWLCVDPGIARWLAVEVFHLLGFRRHAPEGNHLIFSRRRFDW